MTTLRWLVLAVAISVGRAKLCCDQECKRPVSYGRTKDRYITQEAGHLSFPNAAIVTILIKQAEFDSSGQELWFAEIQGRKGLVLAQVVTELHTLCEPKEISNNEANGQGNKNIPELDNPPPPPPPPHTQYDTNTPHIHQPGEADSHILEHKQELSIEQQSDLFNQNAGDIPTKNVHKELSYNGLEEGPNTLGSKEESVNQDDMFHENRNTQSGDLVDKDSGYTEHEYSDQELASYSVKFDTHIVETDQPSPIMDGNTVLSSTFTQESSGTGEPLQSQSLQQPGESDSGEHSIELRESSHQLESGNTASAKNEETFHGVLPSSDLPDEVTDLPPVKKLDNTGFSSDSIVDETPTTEGVPDFGSPVEQLYYEYFDEEQVTNTYTDFGTWSTDGVENVIEQTQTETMTLVHSQDSPLHTPSPPYESQQQPTRFNLKNGESVHVVPLGGGNFQIVTENGLVRVVDYDYLDEQGVELGDYYHQYDDDPGQEEMENDEEEEPAQIMPENEVNTHTEVEEGYPADDQETLTDEEAGEVLGYPPPTTTVGDNQHHHHYLDVHSLRQRYNQRDAGGNVVDHEDGVASEVLTKFTSTEEVQWQESEVINTQLPSAMDPEYAKEKDAIDQTFLPDNEQGTQLVEETEMTIHPQPTSQPFQDIDLSVEDIHIKATHLPLPHMEPVNQQHEPVEGGQQLPSPEALLSETHSQTSTPVHTNKDPSDHQMTIVNLVAQFSPNLAIWINDQGPEFGIVGVIASACCIILPLCCSCCHYWKDSRRKAVKLSKYTASRKGLEEQIEKLKAEKKSVSAELLMSEERFGTLQNELEHMKHENKTLFESKAEIEENYGNVCAELHSLKQELSTATAQVNQVRSELKHEQMQLSAQTSDKEVALQQIALLQSQLKQYDQKVQELEAAREQLEQDSFSTLSQHQELEELHKQVKQELAGSMSKNSELNLRLQTLQEEVSLLQQTKNDNSQEIQTLQNCLSQLVASTADVTDEQEEMTDGQTKNVNSTDTLLKIQAMLDTTKVQAELQAVTLERDQNVANLEEQRVLVRKLQDENTTLREHSIEVETQLSVCTADFQKLQEKHKTLTEYFEQKEHNLHRMLGAEEAVRQAVETREAEVKEKAQSLEQAETRHREELKQLRSEMFEIEKSLMSQVHTCQKRAEDAIAEQRRLEQECKALKLERDDLRKRMTHKSVSPSSGISNVQHSLIARPPSAPYLPRTSSPGVGDTKDHVISQLNQTDPGPLPSSQAQPPFPNTGRPPFFPPPDQRGTHFILQPPLQRPVPEHERPRYPLPPPGRRLIRGYPPFERRPPRPGIYGPIPRYYHDVRVPERRRPVSNPPPGAIPPPPLGEYDPHHCSRNMRDSSTGFVPVAPAVVPESTFQNETVLNPGGEQVSLKRPEGREF